MAHIARNISGDFFVVHDIPIEGVPYDCVGLVARGRGENEHIRLLLNRNGVNANVLPDVWSLAERDGIEAVANLIIEKCQLHRTQEPQTSDTTRLLDTVVAWLDEHEHENFYVGPLQWWGACTRRLDIEPAPFPSATWPGTLHGPEISLGIDGTELLRFRQDETHVESTATSDGVDESAPQKYFAYIYRDPRSRQIRYAGYGTHPGRAYSVGHNHKVAEVVENGDGFEVLIAGPYRDEQEARNVEAALVSALAPDLNLIEQPGNKFRPLGLPNDLGHRRFETPLTVHDIGRITGGALVVLCNLTTELKSGHDKLTPTNFSDTTVFNNIRGHWKVKNFLPQWIEDPSSSPRVLVAVQGPVPDRIVVASAAIDVKRWSDTPWAPWDRHVHEIPLLEGLGLDMSELRGRRVDRLKFGTGPSNYLMWVDETGLVRHGYKIKGTRG